MPGLVAATAHLAPGGGGYELPALTVGVFLTDQPDHRLSVGSDKAEHRPLKRRQGWILPAGAQGLCTFDAPLDVATVSLPLPLLSDAGATLDPEAIAPVVGDLDPLLIEMVVQAGRFEEAGTLYAQTMALALTAQTLKALEQSAPQDAPMDDVRLKRAARYIKEHLADDLSLDGLAAVAAMSPSHFARAFKRATGLAPLQYVIAERLEWAMALLRTTRLSVAEVAYRTGYKDVPRFAQHFKRRFGCTPGAARDR